MTDFPLAIVEERSSTPAPSMREKIFALERFMLEHPQRVDVDEACPVKHHFSKGVYAREMFIPKGICVIGKIHKHENLSVMPMGALLLCTDDGVVTIRAPYTCVAPAGVKRAVYALEDTIFISIHGTDERDLAVIEQQFIAQDETEYLAFCESLKLEGDR